MNSKYIGSTFESFLEEEGILEEVEAQATKEILAEEIAQAMKSRKMNVSQLSRRMQTSRTAVRRLLEPKQKGLTLDTLSKAAAALDCKLTISVVPKPLKPKPKTTPSARSQANARR